MCHFRPYSGDPIPRIKYTEDEVRTWGEVFRRVDELLPNRASKTHRRVLEHMKKECNMTEENIPQMEDISNFLKSKLKHILRNDQ